MVKVDFGFRGNWDPESRLLNPELGGGALLKEKCAPLQNSIDNLLPICCLYDKI